VSRDALTTDTAAPEATVPPRAVDSESELTQPPLCVIEPPQRWIPLNLGEIWRYRDLLFLLVWRDISANYRQSLIGFGWAILRPVISMVIFTVIFGRVAGLPTGGVPYPIFSFTALLPWMYFSGCLTASSSSIVGGSGLLTKVYFPRLILPLATVINGLVEFAIQFLVLLLLMAWYRVTPTWGILLVPVFLLQCATAALSVGLWLTALNVKYRDIGHIVPFLSQAWMWITPIVYSSSMVPEQWRAVYGLNPMVGVVEGFRWAILANAAPDWTMMAVSSTAVLLLLVSGLYYFRRLEVTFADVI
jgi:lipopolysaccharide transport system permease protein